MESITVKAGKYWLGDPCYIISSTDDWNDLCNQAAEQEEDVDRVWIYDINTSAGKAVVCGTARGDGVFYSSDNHEIGVDSGLIGLVPFEYNPEGVGPDSHLVTFTKDFVVSNEDGNMSFGPIKVETADPYYPEDGNQYGEEW